jgi:hypothetical protein
VESHERPSGSSRSRGRSRTGSEQARTGTLPKNLIGRLSRAGSLGRRGSEATAHASSVRAKLALGMAESSNTEVEERGLLSRSTWVCLSRAGSLGRRGSEATAHASSVRAKLALGMAESSNTEGEERGLLSSSTWV